jgi:glycosyltransferase involved in cell wall biosynthesis
MRILALVHRYLPVHCAGAETMLHGMLSALAARGHEVAVDLSAQSGEPYQVDGVQVWPFVSKRNAGTTGRLLAADVLITHLMNTHRATFLGNWNHKPVIVINHNSFNVTRNAALVPQARVDLVVVNSRWMADDLAAHFRGAGRPQPRTIIVRPLVDPADYATTPGDRVTLINLRAMTEESTGYSMGKGSETFWALAERMPRTQFLGVTGAYGVQDIRERGNVEVLSHVAADAMRDKVYARTRVLLVPSSYESWGRVGTEALCSGIPVIAHPTPGLLESRGGAGIFVDRDDIDGWVRELRRLARPAAYTAASKAALARAAELDEQRAVDMAAWCDSVERVAGRRR